MENRHTLVTSNDCVTSAKKQISDISEEETRDNLSSMPSLQGYLFKRTSNAFKTWNRRWFSLQDNHLVYRKRSGKLKDNYCEPYLIFPMIYACLWLMCVDLIPGEDVTIMEEDLRLCTVKPVVDGDRRFCFEVVSPNKLVQLIYDAFKK